MRALLPTLLLLAAAGASCASTSQASLGDLCVVNRSVRPVAFTASWETEEGTYGYVRGLLPGRGTDTTVENDAVPAGTVFHFATSGPGFQEVLRRTVIFEVRPGNVRGSGSTAKAAAILDFHLSGVPLELLLIDEPEATWVYPGRGATAVVSGDHPGALEVH